MDDFIGVVLAVCFGAWLLMIAVYVLMYIAVILAVVAAIGFALYWAYRGLRAVIEQAIAPGLIRWSVRRTARQINDEIEQTTTRMQEITLSRAVLPISDDTSTADFGFRWEEVADTNDRS